MSFLTKATGDKGRDPLIIFYKQNLQRFPFSATLSAIQHMQDLSVGHCIKIDSHPPDRSHQFDFMPVDYPVPDIAECLPIIALDAAGIANPDAAQARCRHDVELKAEAARAAGQQHSPRWRKSNNSSIRGPAWPGICFFMKRAYLIEAAAESFGSEQSIPDRVAIYDVDRTITRLPTYSRFLLQSMAYRWPWRACLIPLLLPVVLPYAVCLLTRRHMKQAMHWATLGRHIPRKQAEALAEMFAQSLFANGLYPPALAQIERDREEGWHIMLATAAPDFYIEPLARRLGIADVVATRSLWQHDQLSCRIDGENCYGAAKLERIRQALAFKGIDRSRVRIRFYSDHVSDRQVCEWADEPIAVNASRSMASLAREKGWRQLDWRQS